MERTELKEFKTNKISGNYFTSSVQTVKEPFVLLYLKAFSITHRNRLLSEGNEQMFGLQLLFLVIIYT